MCNKRNSKTRNIQGRKIRLDSCIADLILALNEHGIKTLGSCCGHGKHPITIVYESKDGQLKGNIYDFCSGWGILRKRRFYVKGKDGLFYIPEVEHPFTESKK